VPSPIPSVNVEARAICRILGAGIIVIASGGRRIPVMQDDKGDYHGLEAASSTRTAAGEVHGARDRRWTPSMMLTDVEHALLNFGKAMHPRSAK